jgi:hypothetical protein
MIFTIRHHERIYTLLSNIYTAETEHSNPSPCLSSTYCGATEECHISSILSARATTLASHSVLPILPANVNTLYMALHLVRSLLVTVAVVLLFTTSIVAHCHHVALSLYFTTSTSSTHSHPLYARLHHPAWHHPRLGQLRMLPPYLAQLAVHRPVGNRGVGERLRSWGRRGRYLSSDERST